MADSISNSDNTIDSRDVIARIEELEGDREALAENVSDAEESLADARDAYLNASEDIDAGQQAVENAQKKLDDALAALKAWDEDDDGKELKALQALQSEAEGYSDWLHGAQLINESYFTQYAQELAEEIGAIASDAQWPLRHINWDAAAEELKQDYTTVDFDGTDYYIR